MLCYRCDHGHRIRNSRLHRLCASFLNREREYEREERKWHRKVQDRRWLNQIFGSDEILTAGWKRDGQKPMQAALSRSHRSATLGSDVHQGSCSVEDTRSVIIVFISTCPANHLMRVTGADYEPWRPRIWNTLSHSQRALTQLTKNMLVTTHRTLEPCERDDQRFFWRVSRTGRDVVEDCRHWCRNPRCLREKRETTARQNHSEGRRGHLGHGWQAVCR